MTNLSKAYWTSDNDDIKLSMPIAKVGMPKIAPVAAPMPAPGSAVVAKVQTSHPDDDSNEGESSLSKMFFKIFNI